jgi:hypothetical protein
MSAMGSQPGKAYSEQMFSASSHSVDTMAGVQIMVKDSKKYASTGGWGFGRFIDRKPVDEAQHKTCFPCHEAAKGA